MATHPSKYRPRQTAIAPIAAMLLLIISVPLIANCQDTPAADGPPDPIRKIIDDEVKKIGPNDYEIGTIHIDSAAKEITFPAKVNMNEGLIEVIISTPLGKLHEAVLVADIQPLRLHVALLLLSQTPGSNPGWDLLPDHSMRPEGWDRPLGSTLEVFVSWNTPDGTREVPAHELLMDIRSKRSMPKTGWVFVGSRIGPRGDYFADGHGSVMTSYHDFTSVLDNPLTAGRLDEYMYVNHTLVPKPGTPVRVRITPSTKQ